MNKIELPFAILTYDEPIVFLRYKHEVKVDVEDMYNMFKASYALSKNESYLLLVDAKVLVDVTPEARKVGSNKKNTLNIIANAIVVKWLAQRLLSNVFIEINKPHLPVRIFNDEKKAIKWLLEKHKESRLILEP